MGDTPLNNDPNQASLLSSVNALYGALRGALIPRDAAGQAADGAADLGDPTRSFDAAYVKRLFVGGTLLDFSALLATAPVYVFTATDAAFAWPLIQPRCLAIAVSGCGGGGGARNNTSNPAAGDGAVGAATTVTIGATTLSSGQGPGGPAGSQFSLNPAANNIDRWSDVVEQLTTRERIGAFAPPFPHFAPGGLTTSTTDRRRDGAVGRSRIQSRLFTGLTNGDMVNVQIGAGGAGGAGGNGGTNDSDFDGATGPDGFVILFALN